MRFTAPILAAAGAAILTASIAIVHAAAPPPIDARTVATTTTTPASTVTVIGTGAVQGTPDEATISFGVEVTAASASAAFSDEASQSQRLLSSLRSAGVKEGDIQTEWVSLYPNQPAGGYTASSSVSALIHGIAHAGSVIDAAVRATGDAIRLSGISLSIGDTSALMSSARSAAVHNAQSKAREYAQAAGMKLGSGVSISESDTGAQPVRYAGALPTASQPIEAGQQTLQVSVTVVYALTQ